MDLSIIVPVYNEETRMADCIGKIREAVVAQGYSYEFLIVEDGSVDGSLQIARSLAASDSRIRVIHNDRRVGRGRSLETALRTCKNEYVLYMDADLSTDLKHVPDLVNHLEHGAAIATGSRLIRDAICKRPASRDIPSKGFNHLVRLLFRSRIHDHQCGFKGFRKSAILPLLGEIKDNHWFWDTELLVLAQRNCLPTAEFPVLWLHNGGSRASVSKVKVYRDTLYMGKRIVGLRIRLSKAGQVRLPK